MNKVYILLPVHNRKHITERFMNCLSKQTYRQYQLILIDDGSTDGTLDMVKEYEPSVICIRGNGNLWWGGSLHEGYKWICKNEVNEEDIVMITNDDTEFEETFLEKAVNLLNTMQNTLLLAVNYNREREEIVSGGVEINWRTLSFSDTLDAEKIDCLPTRGLFMFVKDFKRIGGFYPKLLPHYLSDYEYTIRAKKMGYNLRVEESLRIYIDISTTGYYDVLSEKNTVTFLKKYFSKKCQSNPITWTMFILLAAPMKWKIPNLLRVWGTTLLKILFRKKVLELKQKRRKAKVGKF